WADNGADNPEGFTPGSASTNFFYDVNGNILKTQVNRAELNGNGSQVNRDTIEYWYEFDFYDRVVISKGHKASGATLITEGSEGSTFTYDLVGRRMSSSTGNGPLETYQYNFDDTIDQVFIDGVLKADFTYDAQQRVTEQIEYRVDGPSGVPEVAYQHYNIYYDADGRVTSDKKVWFQKDDDGDFRSHSDT
ncbi:hypothetical protein RMQ97_15505, partial [Maricaulis sp. D1M11]|uniref:hypothetical protein n=1 Tax=Maricaulis sp. D1M11 TaxID=3076117 RepID=UPI0039B5297D